MVHRVLHHERWNWPLFGSHVSSAGNSREVTRISARAQRSRAVDRGYTKFSTNWSLFSYVDRREPGWPRSPEDSFRARYRDADRINRQWIWRLVPRIRRHGRVQTDTPTRWDFNASWLPDKRAFVCIESNLLSDYFDGAASLSGSKRLPRSLSFVPLRFRPYFFPPLP